MSNRSFFESLHPHVVVDKELPSTRGTSEIVLLSWNANGTRLVNSRTDKSIRIWKVHQDTFSEPVIIQDCHSKTVESVSWNPVTEFSFATAGRDNCIKIWDTNGQMTKEINVNKANNIVAFSPDGRYLAAIDRDSIISILDVKNSYKLIHTFTIREHVYGFTWSNTSDFFFTALRDGTVPLYKFDPSLEGEDKVKVMHSLKSHRSATTCVKMDPRGKFVVVGSNEGAISLWKTDKLICFKTITHIDEAISSIDIAWDGRHIAVTYDNNVNGKIFECETWEERLELKNSMAGNLSIPQVAFCPSKIALLYTSDRCSKMTYLHK